MRDLSKDALAREHMDLVEKMVAIMQKRFGPVVEPDELRSYGMEGLAAAIDQFDESRKVPFQAYATIRIKGAMYDGLSAASWFPRRLIRQISFYKKADDMMNQSSHDPPPVDTVETAHRLADRLKDLATAYVTTYAAPEENEQASTPAEAEFTSDRRRYYVLVNAYVKALPERQRHILQRFFFEDQQLSDIAEEIGCSKSWTSRLLRSALNGIREKFGESPEPIESFQPR